MSKKVLISLVALLIVAILAGVWISGEASAQSSQPLIRRVDRTRALGQVKALTSGQLAIVKRDGQESSYILDENTVVRDAEGIVLSVADLAVGRWVIVVAVTNEAGNWLARAVVLLPEDFDPSQYSGVVGRVSSVDALANMFRVKDREGNEQTYQVDQETRFVGDAQDLNGLSEGMPVGVVFQTQADGSLLAKIVRTRRGIFRHFGRISEVDLAGDTFTLITREAGEELNFLVDENTRFRSKGDTVQSLGDLQPGMVGFVLARPAASEGEKPVAALVAAASPDQLPKFDLRAAGRITSIGANSFTITARDGSQRIFQVNEETRYRSRGGLVQSLDDLDEGMLVIVGAKDLGDGSYLAQLVIVLRRMR